MAFNSNKDNHRGGYRRKKSSISDINITPFVDVLLVLLIIFMVAAPMMTSNVELTLPKGSAAPTNEKSEPISISIKSDGSIFLQDEAIKMHSLPSKLREITNNNFDSKIFVRADQKLDYGRVMEVVKIINSAGFTQVVLVTELTDG
jgi:biopolymer transport protein TolR